MFNSNVISPVATSLTVSQGLDPKQTGAGFSFRPGLYQNPICATRLSVFRCPHSVSTSCTNARTSGSVHEPTRRGVDCFGICGRYHNLGEATRTAAKIGGPRWNRERRAFQVSEHDSRLSTLQRVSCYSRLSGEQSNSRGNYQGLSTGNSLLDDSIYGREEQRWLREEQRWLREEKRWLREEQKWEREVVRANNQALQEIKSLKNSILERQEQIWSTLEREKARLTADNITLQEEIKSMKTSMHQREEQRWQREEQRWLREEQRWLREEKRWLKEEQKWEREGERWAAANLALQQEVNFLKKKLEQLQVQKGYEAKEITDISLRNVVAEMRNLLNALALPNTEQYLLYNLDTAKQIADKGHQSGGESTKEIGGTAESPVLFPVTFVAFRDKVIAVVNPSSPVSFVAYANNVIAVVTPAAASSGNTADPKSSTAATRSSSQFASRASNNTPKAKR